MQHHFIINPAAGKGTLVRSLTERIRTTASERGVNFEIYLTKHPRDAVNFVTATLAKGGERHRFYACGGDGTLGEVVSGAPLCERAEFALIPIGTGNDFCRNFSDRSAFFDIDRQLDGEAMPIDLIRYNDRYCVNMLNVGFDCNVVVKTLSLKKKAWIPSGMAYSAGVALALMQKMSTPMYIELEDGEKIERPLLLLSLANGQFYGGGFRSNPCALLSDGLFDINIIEKVSRATFLSLVGAYKAGKHLEVAAKYITYRKARSVYIRFDEETMLCADGELEPVTEVKAEILPGAARFVVPRSVLCLSTQKEELPEEIPEKALI